MGSKGKLVKYRIMKRDSLVRKHLPLTKHFNRDHFYSMINRNRSVIVKPTFGSGGVGVIKVSSKGNQYIIHKGSSKRTVKGKSGAYAYVKRLTGSKSYIVQRYIPLAKIKGRPIDLRVMVQRTNAKPWTITGKLVKVAGANHIITNVARSKGYVLPTRVALQQIFSKRKTFSVLRKMDHIALRTAKQLQRSFTSYRITGLDMGVDKKGKVWVIESNSKPALSLFLKLKDKKQYRRIMSYIKK